MDEVHTIDLSDTEAVFTINHSFAKKFQHKKLKEEMGVFQQSSSDESCSDIEDDDGVLLTPQVDAQILKTILMLRNKAPEVYDEKIDIFGDLEHGEDLQPVEKAFRLKEHHTRELLKLDGYQDVEKQEFGATHVQELEKVKSDFITAASLAQEDEEELLTKKTSEKMDDGYSAFLLDTLRKDGVNEDKLKAFKDVKG